MPQDQPPPLTSARSSFTVFFFFLLCIYDHVHTCDLLLEFLVVVAMPFSFPLPVVNPSELARVHLNRGDDDDDEQLAKSFHT